MKAVHPEGFYKKYPLVTWDLGAERWLGNGRSDVMTARCWSCYWTHSEAVLAKPERLRVAEFITECQHWYSCTAGPPQVQFTYLRAYLRYA